MRFNIIAILYSLQAIPREIAGQNLNRLRSGTKERKPENTGRSDSDLIEFNESSLDAETESLERTLLLSSMSHLSPPAPEPTLKPTKAPTPKPTKKPTLKPTEAPTLKPTKKPTPKPTKKPTPKPTGKPSYKPSASPKDCCGLRPGQREQQLFDIYSTVSNPKDILTLGSPQNLAFQFVLNTEQYCLCPNETSCELVQRYVMAVYYYSTKGDDWVNCGAKSAVCDPEGTTNPISKTPTSGCFPGSDARWLSPVSSCKWCGNICEAVDNTCITQIDLESINQSGTLPFELQNITFLYYLDNEDGTISSTIPPQLGNLANLSFIDMDFQNLSGSIPGSLYKLPLSTLDLNDNKLTGSISNDICNFKNLDFLQLGNEDKGTNNFSGTTIPACVGSLTKLSK